MTVTEDLQARLRARKPSGSMGFFVCSREQHESVERWWLHNSGSSDAKVAETLVLLNVLARVDYSAFQQEIYPNSTRRCYIQPRNITVGMVLQAYDTERFLKSIQAMDAAMAEAREALQHAIPWLEGGAQGPRGYDLRPVPVQVHSRWVSKPKRTSLLREILQHQSDHVDGTRSTVRYEVVEVDLSAIDIGDLRLLTQLLDRGIRIPTLSLLHAEVASSEARRALTESLHLLMPPRRTFTPKLHIEHIRISCDPDHLHASLFAGLQRSRTIKRVELCGYEDDTDDWEVMTREQQKPLVSLWSWVAYALFSRHAQHEIQEVLIGYGFFTDATVRVMRQVLKAENPLAAMFGTAFARDRWLIASKFTIGRPGNDTSAPATLLTTQDPLPVRAINKQTMAGTLWWHVLLPGCGDAWVRDEDATTTVAPDIQPIAALDIRFEDLRPRDEYDAREFLHLLSPHVRSIIVESCGGVYDEDFDIADGYPDMTYWVTEVVRACPTLERFEMPSWTNMENLSVFIECATTRNLRLRELVLKCMLDTDTSDVIELFEVLCDMSHPLTRHLEKLLLQLYIPDDAERDFRAAWERLLRENRKLEKITLMVGGLNNTEEESIIRTGPLSIPSKLAFLSVVQESSGVTPASRLDANAIGMIFEYAATCVFREIRIEASDW